MCAQCGHIFVDTCVCTVSRGHICHTVYTLSAHICVHTAHTVCTVHNVWIICANWICTCDIQFTHMIHAFYLAGLSRSVHVWHDSLTCLIRVCRARWWQYGWWSFMAGPRARLTFSKVRPVVLWHSQCSRELTFENVYQQPAERHQADIRNTLQHPATPCNTLQHTGTHCNTLQHMLLHATR